MRNCWCPATLLLVCVLVRPCFSQVVSADRIQVNRVPGSSALKEFLKRFDPISQRGYVRTLRSGSTGIGYTLETLLDIPENNSPRGDLSGLEIKAYRVSESRTSDRSRMNLFLKEPEWLDGKSSAQRIRDYGYTDPNGRRAWYQSVTSKRNGTGLALRVDRSGGVVYLQRQGTDIGGWSFDVLSGRLSEKLSEVVFVGALTRGHGRDEHFHYQTVTWYSRPSADVLTDLIDAGDVILELRMHIKPSGGARNHGTAFRIRKDRLVDLYRIRRVCRSDRRRPAARFPS